MVTPLGYMTCLLAAEVMVGGLPRLLLRRLRRLLSVAACAAA